MKYTERIIPEDVSKTESEKIYLQHTARYEFASKFVAGKKVLDIACGVGYGSKILQQADATHVHGCDISDEAIGYARQHYTSDTITFEVMDATKVTFPDNVFDCVVSFETIEHIKNYEDMIMEFYRILKDNGLLIISTPNREIDSKDDSKPNNPFHIMEFNRQELLDLLGKKFSNVCLYSQLILGKISFWRRIFRYLLHGLMRIDFMKLHTRVLSNKMYAKIGDMIVNIKQNTPILYQNEHRPLVFVAVCRKKNHN